MTKYIGTLFGAFLLLVLVGGGCSSKTKDISSNEQNESTVIENTGESNNIAMEETNTSINNETINEETTEGNDEKTAEDETPTTTDTTKEETIQTINTTPTGAVQAYFEAQITGADGAQYMLPTAITHHMIQQILAQTASFIYTEVSTGDVTDMPTKEDASNYEKAFGAGTYKYVMTNYKATVDGMTITQSDTTVVKEDNGLWYVVRPAM